MYIFVYIFMYVCRLAWSPLWDVSSCFRCTLKIRKQSQPFSLPTNFPRYLPKQNKSFHSHSLLQTQIFDKIPFAQRTLAKQNATHSRQRINKMFWASVSVNVRGDKSGLPTSLSFTSITNNHTTTATSTAQRRPSNTIKVQQQKHGNAYFKFRHGWLCVCVRLRVCLTFRHET